jgi:hypothetical protein
MKKSPAKHKPAAPKQDGGASGSGKTNQTAKEEPMREEGVQDRTIHNGSAGAFDATEHSHDDDEEDQDSDDFAMDR